MAGIDFPLQEYFTLIDWTGRTIKHNKRGAIPANILPILERLQVNESEWVNTVNHFGRRFYRVIGPIEAVRKIGKRINHRWLKGLLQCEKLYKTALSPKSL